MVLTAGFGMVLLAGLYWLVELRGWRRWAKPFVVFGTNSLFVFALSGLLAKSMVFIKITVGQAKLAPSVVEGACPPDCGAPTALRQISLHSYIYNRFFAPLASPENASLLFAVCFVLLFLALNWLL